MAGTRVERPPVARDNVAARAPPAANTRRALGDIGNLVGAMAVRCHVSKDDTINPKQDIVTTWGAKQRRTVVCGSDGKVEAKTEAVSEENNAHDKSSSTECEAAIPLPVPAGHPPRLKPLTRSTRNAAAKKVPTLTATLTARSEAIIRHDIEMMDAEEHVHNIDEGDANNQLCVVDYVEDIYSFYRKTEVQSCVAPDYMCRQGDINDKMRAILIDWLIEVHLKFGLMPETLFLTTNLLDRYLSLESVSRKTLQLVGVTAMLLAAKYEEISAPEVEAIVFISDDAYTRQQVLAMVNNSDNRNCSVSLSQCVIDSIWDRPVTAEVSRTLCPVLLNLVTRYDFQEKAMLNTLRFNLTVPTPYVFMVRCLKAASSDKQTETLAFFFVELCLTEYVAVRYSPSLLAASAVFTAHHTLQKSPYWTPTLSRHSGYDESELRACARLMVGLHQKSAEAKLMVVHKKYSSSKFQSVATLTPANLSCFDLGSDV